VSLTLAARTVLARAVGARDTRPAPAGPAACQVMVSQAVRLPDGVPGWPLPPVLMRTTRPSAPTAVIQPLRREMIV